MWIGDALVEKYINWIKHLHITYISVSVEDTRRDRSLLPVVCDDETDKISLLKQLLVNALATRILPIVNALYPLHLNLYICNRSGRKFKHEKTFWKQ